MNQQGPFTKFEEELAEAMHRVDPPEGFAERVLARAEAGEAPRARVLAMPSRRPMWASGAIAAALLVGALLGEQAHLRHEREKAELARQRAAVAQKQFELAMRITSDTLEHVQRQLQQAGIATGN